MKFIIWGTGRIFDKYRKYINLSNVEALVDNDQEKWGNDLVGSIVISPSEIENYSYDYIIIMVKKYTEIRNQLKLMNIDENKIIDSGHLGIFDNVILQRKYEIMRPLSNTKKIALISHTLDRTGAPMMLLNLAKVLIKNGYEVDVYSFGEEDLVDDFLRLNISVTMFANDNFNREFCKEIFIKYDVVWANTLDVYKIVNMLKIIDKPVVWWIHEEEDYMKKCLNDGMQIDTYNNLSIYGVGNRVKDTFGRYYPNINFELLPYGIEHKEAIQKKKGAKLVFAIIGSVCERKGQDILIRAIYKNYEEWKDIAEFWVIGKITGEKRSDYEKIDIVKVFGEKTHYEVMELYQYIDVILCPSLNDPLPVVVAEGMQQKKACIVSNMTGMAAYVSQYENGLVCEAENSDDLSNCINWIMENRDKIIDIGERGHQIYIDNFSMESFNDRVIGIIEGVV